MKAFIEANIAASLARPDKKLAVDRGDLIAEEAEACTEDGQRDKIVTCGETHGCRRE